MSPLTLVAIVVIGALVLLAFLRGQGDSQGTGDTPYQSARWLFTPSERAFLGVFDQAVGNEHRIFGKVRVADVATVVRKGNDQSDRWRAFNRIAAKHFDFVVCRADDLSLVCAVELNDHSHTRQRRQASDDLKSRVCEAIGLPLLSVVAKQAYSVQELRAQFRALGSASPA